ncbi:hypothetical protein [Microbacterium xanthum]|uniref:hypothetical protein n=1 Tax=Microbacterium xanthum TaxID=3079794 RepID=UPI002AD1E89F|nr:MULTISPECIES: hypothetical protein [unclassified Microbacterium]MDZ8172111.1 hypothetical protein [Microbacterium sp. KSW-48]MDZ8202182.1 hypothetical protein [Microbacterium sp. SSW1-59]
MSTSAEHPAHDGSDLAALREEIDELKKVPEEEMVNPTPHGWEGREPTPAPTDSIGSERWEDRPSQD